jgi:hypothetical protein
MAFVDVLVFERKGERSGLKVIYCEKERDDDMLLAPALVKTVILFQYREVIGRHHQQQIEIGTAQQEFSSHGTAVEQNSSQLTAIGLLHILHIGL